MKHADSLIHCHFDPSGFLVLDTNQSQTRIWFLGEGIVRVRTSFSKDFREESLSLVWTAWPDLYDTLLYKERQRTVPLIPVVDDSSSDHIRITCDMLTITVSKDPFALSVTDGSGNLLFRDVPGRAYTQVHGQITHSFCLDDCHFYGFGETTGSLEKTGCRMRFAPKDACGYDPRRTDPLYKHVPWFIKYNAEGNRLCGVYYNTSSDCELDMGREYNGYWPRMGQYLCHSDEVDLFLVTGQTMSQILGLFTKLTGRPALLPRYALGYLGSTMFYSELPENCDREILDFVDRTKAQAVPCSNFQLSSGYTTDANCKRNVFYWNRTKFPDPEAFIRQMEAKNAPVTPNIKPALLTTNPLYDTFRQAGAFIRNSDGSPYLTRFWGGQGSFVDFTNPNARALWKTCLKTHLLDYGIHSLWNDNNEFDIASDDAICENEGHPVSALLVRARLPMLMNITARQALEEYCEDQRGYLVTRSGNTGICRYAQTWTGDNRTGWDSLRYNIATMLGSSLSGLALTGSDIGGFAGPAPEAELFIRWIWCGVLLPRFSIHSANNDNTVTEPWMYPEHMDSIRKAFRLRDALLPYLYSLSAHAHATGAPILRPLVYEFPKDCKVHLEDVDFMVGGGLLAACVVEEGADERSVYLPEKEVFYDFFTRKCYSGGQIITVPAPLDSTPLFQRGGSILPLQAHNSLHLMICPDKDCGFTLYEDDGVSNAYKIGNYRKTHYQMTRRQELVTITQTAEGVFAPEYSIEYHVQCTNKAPAAVSWNGQVLAQYLNQDKFDSSESGWHYSHSKKMCLIKHGNGRDLEKLLVSFGTFDLIRMDE